MNIFILHLNPMIAARAHCDKHVNKMIVEHIQMMSVALALRGLDPAKKKDGNYYSTKAYKNHPCTKWVAESWENFEWTYNLTWALCDEFKTRYGKEHSGRQSLLSIKGVKVETFPRKENTHPYQAMPDFCKVSGDPVAAYRNCYNFTKWEFASWERAPQGPPSWWAPQSLIITPPALK